MKWLSIEFSMTYCWHNIMPKYGNKIIKYSVDGGSNWEIVTFVNGMYEFL